MGRLTKHAVRAAARDVQQNGGRYVKNYFTGLFPIIDWLPRYNVKWAFGDLIAGVTVGFVVIPQALSYAKLAGVPLEYGLYTSFVGTLVYPFFATSKDVTIGATAVLSMLVGQLMASNNSNHLDPVTFGTSVSLLAGIIQAAIGFLRLGAVVELISVPVVAGFTSGAAFQIIFGQLSGLLGIANINTNDPPYLVLYNTLSQLNKTRLDAAFGLSAVAVLLAFRFVTRLGVRRGYGWFIWIGHASNIVTLVFFTLLSWLIYRNTPKTTVPIKLVGAIPTGLTYFKVPSASNFSSLLSPAVSVVLVGIIEHIAMVKAFGRLNGYKADPNQEIVALGLSNIITPFFGGFPSTGSLSRSSIKSRSGVKTPFAGFFTSVIVLLSIYLLTPAFYYIPSAILSAIIVVAISDLVSRPSVVKQLWDVEFFDFLSFFVAFWITIFVSIEMAVYVSVGFSVLVLLYRVAYPQINVLTRVDNQGGWVNFKDHAARDKHAQLTPFPGVAVFRVEEALTYPNASYLTEHIKAWVQENTKSGRDINEEVLWNVKSVPESPSIAKLVSCWLGG
ncbi:hypothetical protein HDU91_001200 [Kappamyces sp. JEL0680]|nr:hypothetical protein HDU91_001200 [Kappamyces sp. JEL0680]